jgi:hypothetical protein
MNAPLEGRAAGGIARACYDVPDDAGDLRQDHPHDCRRLVTCWPKAQAAFGERRAMSDGAAAQKPPPKSNLSKVIRWGAGIVVAALAAFLTTQSTWLMSKLWNDTFPENPLNVTAIVEPTCPSVFTSPVDKVQQDLDAALKANPNATVADLNPIDGTETKVKITVNSTSDDKVSLNDIDVVVDKRERPSGVYVGQCGAVQPVQFYSTNLDEAKPVLVPAETSGGHTQVFAYTVTSSDPEVFYVVAKTAGCDCTWHLVLKWSSGKHSGEQQINSGDKPFRTSGTDGLPGFYQSLDNRLMPFG